MMLFFRPSGLNKFAANLFKKFHTFSSDDSGICFSEKTFNLVSVLFPRASEHCLHHSSKFSRSTIVALDITLNGP